MAVKVGFSETITLRGRSPGWFPKAPCIARWCPTTITDRQRWTGELKLADLRRFTAIIEREESRYSALCPEYDIASQGTRIEEARDNLVEALSLFFECADTSDAQRRFQPEVLVTQIEDRVG